MGIDELRKMDLHQTVHVGDSTFVMRVVDGWIYNTRLPNNRYSSVFVPEQKTQHVRVTGPQSIR